MRAVGLFVLSEMRARWRAWVALVLLIAVAGGTVLLAVAGARRTDTAYSRLLQSSEASDVTVSPSGTGLTGYYSALRRLPGVETLGTEAGVTAFVVGKQGRPVLQGPPLLYLAVDTTYGSTVDRPRIVLGRLARSAQANEVVVSVNAASADHVTVGSNLELFVPTGNSSGPSIPSSGLRLRERVVGVVVMRTDVVTITPLESAPEILGTPALLRRLLPAIGGPRNLAFDAALVRLKPHTTPGRFDVVAQDTARKFPDTGRQVFIADERADAAAVQRAIRPEAVALALFAAVAALTAVVVLGQLAVRQLAAQSSGWQPLRALGCTRWQLAMMGLSQVTLAAMIGALGALVLAVGVSPLMPIGPARVAEPHPGVEVNVAVLIVGALVIVVLLAARVMWPIFRMVAGARGPEGVLRPERPLTTWLNRNAPITAGLGVKMAFDRGPGYAAVPVTGSLVAVVIAVAAVMTSLVFGVNLSRFVSTPHLYGRNWDVMLDPQSGFTMLSRGEVASFVARQPDLAAWSVGDHGTVELRGRVVAAVGIDTGQGAWLGPTLLEGRRPSSPEEIALGTSTLRRLGKKVGDEVEASVSGRQVRLHIVGRAVFPAFSQGSFAPTDLGEGALTTASALSSGDSSSQYNFFLVRFADTPAKAREVSSLITQFAPQGGYDGCRSEACGVNTRQLPTDVANYSHIEWLPVVLAGVLALLAVGVLVQVLLLLIDRAHRDTAVLRASGFVRRQVMSVVRWQASTIAVVAIAFGVPLGVGAGRWCWILFTDAIGAGTSAIVPTTYLAVAVPAVLVIANAAAAIPARRAGRLSTVTILRAE